MKLATVAVLLALTFGIASAGTVTFKVTSPVDVGDICSGLVDALGTAVDRAKLLDEVTVDPKCSKSGRTHTLTITMASVAAGDALTIKVQGIMNVFVARGLPCGSTWAITGKTGGTRSVGCTAASGSKAYASKALCCSGSSSTSPSSRSYAVNIAVTAPRGTKDCRKNLSAFNSLLSSLGLTSRLSRSASCRVSGSRVLITSTFRDRSSASTFVSGYVRRASTIIQTAGLSCGSSIVIDAPGSAGTRTLNCAGTGAGAAAVSALCCGSSGGDVELPPYAAYIDVDGAGATCDDLEAGITTTLESLDISALSMDCESNAQGASVYLELATETEMGDLLVYMDTEAASFVADVNAPCGATITADTESGSLVLNCDAGVDALCCAPTGSSPAPPASPTPATPSNIDNYITIDVLTGTPDCTTAAAALTDLITMLGQSSDVAVAPFCIKSLISSRAYIGFGLKTREASVAFAAKLQANFDAYRQSAKIPCGSSIILSLANSPSLLSYSCAASGFPNSFALASLCCIAPPPTSPVPSPITPGTPGTPTPPGTPGRIPPGNVPVNVNPVPAPLPAGQATVKITGQQSLVVANVPAAVCSNPTAMSLIASSSAPLIAAELAKRGGNVKLVGPVTAVCTSANENFTLRRLQQSTFTNILLTYTVETTVDVSIAVNGANIMITQSTETCATLSSTTSFTTLLDNAAAVAQVSSFSSSSKSCSRVVYQFEQTATVYGGRRLAGVAPTWWEEEEETEDQADILGF